jgi:hypothetical protein
MTKVALKTNTPLSQAHCLSPFKPILFTYLNLYDLYVYFFHNALKINLMF